MKKANIASQGSSKTKKLKNRKRVKYGKKGGPDTVLEKKAVTYFDLRKQKDNAFKNEPVENNSNLEPIGDKHPEGHFPESNHAISMRSGKLFDVLFSMSY